MIKLSKNNIQVLCLYASTLMSSLLGFVVSVVNTNFLTEVEYGDVRYVQNYIILLSWLLFFGYFFSARRLLSLSDDEGYRRRIRGAMLLVLLACSVLLVIGVVVGSFFHYGQENVFELFIVSVSICFQPLFVNYVSVMMQGDNYIGRLAISRVLPPLLYVILAYSIFSLYGASAKLVLLLQWGIYCVSLCCIIASTRPVFRKLAPVFDEIKKENSLFGSKLYCGSLAMVATNYLAGITLSFFNDDNVGVAFYTLALTLTTPLSYLPAIIGAAYFKRFVSEKFIPKKVFRGALFITVFSFLFFIACVRFVVDWFYPDAYDVVGVYALYLAIAFCVHGLGDMINYFLSSHGDGKAIRNSSYMCGFIKIFGFVFFVWLWDIEGALFTNVVSSCVYCLSLYIYYRKECFGKNK